MATEAWGTRRGCAAQLVEKVVMEEKDYSPAIKQSLREPFVWAAVLAGVYLAVLPMSNTIALRSAALVGLLLVLVSQYRAIEAVRHLGWSVAVWAIYLILFPMFSNDHVVAWQSFTGQWGRGLLAMLAGAGAATLWTISKPRKDIFVLGVLSAAPIFVHLILVTFQIIETGMIPWGYWGRETHHADLGYAAGHAVLLLSSVMVSGGKNNRIWPATIILCCVSSLVIARSRAGLAFAVSSVLLVLLLAYLRPGAVQRKKRLTVIAVSLLFGIAIFALAFKTDPRWNSTLDKLSAGFLGNAMQIQCEGTVLIEAEIVKRFVSEDQKNTLIDSVRSGDASRITALRAGLELALMNPWGSDGSRQAFARLLRRECAEPAIQMAHTHNGWVDTVLAIGWVGGVLYLIVLVSFFQKGKQSYQANGPVVNPWCLVLVALPVFWLIRGLTDSVYRDHMLEMQCFLMAYALVRVEFFKAVLIKRKLDSA